MKIYSANVGMVDLPRDGVLVFSDDMGLPPRLASRKYKCLPHLFLERGHTTLYLDANVWFSGNAQEIIGDADIALFAHPYRQTIRQEIAALEGSHYHEDALRIAADFGEEVDAPGLFECGVLFRRDCDKVTVLNELWWAMVCRYSTRDQLTFPLALHRVPDIKVRIIPGNVRCHPDFVYAPHGQKITLSGNEIGSSPV